MCKHVAAVARRAEREGWDFGRIAPLARLIDQGQPVGTARTVERPAQVIAFRPCVIAHEQAAATARANADLFGA